MLQLKRIIQPLNHHYFYTKIFQRNISSLFCHQSVKYYDKSVNRTLFKYNESINIRLPLLIHQRSFSYNECVTSFWKTISNSTPVGYVQDGLIKIHDISGLPWWATIILSTILFRTIIIFPLAVYQNIITSRIERITLEMPAIVSELKKETAIAMKKYQWTEKQARFIYNRSLKKQWNNLIVRDNCHPAKTFIVLWAQIPLWIFQSVAIRNLVSMLPDPSKLDAQIIYTELTMGGFGWIPNLTEIDSSLIFPITLGLLNLSIIELQTIVRTKPPGKLQRYATNFFRILAVGMIPIAANVPSCLCLYWVTSSTYGLVQNLTLLSPKMRRLLRIPKTKNEIENPYQHIVYTIKNKLKMKNELKVSMENTKTSSSSSSLSSSPSKSLK